MKLFAWPARFSNLPFSKAPQRPRPVAHRALPTLETLEARIAPAMVFAIDSNNHLLTFDSATPETILNNVTITGLAAPGETIRAIDVRPGTGELFALGIENAVGTDAGRIYFLNSSTGAATQVGSNPFSTALVDNSSYGFDFNPQTDSLRVVNRADQNFSVSPTSGFGFLQDPLGAAGTEDIVATAYSQNFSGANQTTLYGYDFALDDLVRIGGINGTGAEGSPDKGLVNKVGDSGVVAGSAANLGLDILTTVSGDQGYASILTGNLYRFYSISLGTGAASLIGSIGNGATAIADIALALPTLPTITLLNATTATYTDVDGDLVTITTTKGTFEAGDFKLYPAGPDGVIGGAKLSSLTIGEDVNDIVNGLNIFENSNLTFSTKPGPLGGDGMVNIGSIHATGVNLGTVTVNGDLNSIDAGMFSAAAPLKAAVGKLNAYSIGALMQPGNGDYLSTIKGPLGALNLKTDLSGWFTITNSGGAFGKLGSANIGGSLIGTDLTKSGRLDISSDSGPIKIFGDLRAGSADESGKLIVNGTLKSLSIGGSIIGGTDSIDDVVGQVRVSGNLGPVVVKHDIIGTDSSYSGRIQTGGNLASLTVGGSVLAGDGELSGSIFSTGDIGKVTIKNNLSGGASLRSGSIIANGKIAAVAIGGSLIGGTGESSGLIQGARLDSALIAGDLVGGAGTFSGNLSSTSSLGTLRVLGSILGGDGNASAKINVTGRAKSLSIGHNLQGGAAPNTPSGNIVVGGVDSITIGGDVIAGSTANAFAISSANDIGSLMVRGNLVGTSDHRLLISADGSANSNPAKQIDLTFGKIFIGGNAESTDLLAGFTANTSSNADAQIGSVFVGGNWSACNLVAGADAGTDQFFGTADDLLGANDDAAITARIAGIVIKGSAFGTAKDSDHFGFVAQTIGSLKIGQKALALTSDNNQSFLLGGTLDLSVREI